MYQTEQTIKNLNITKIMTNNIILHKNLFNTNNYNCINTHYINFFITIIYYLIKMTFLLQYINLSYTRELQKFPAVITRNLVQNF